MIIRNREFSTCKTKGLPRKHRVQNLTRWVLFRMTSKYGCSIKYSPWQPPGARAGAVGGGDVREQGLKQIRGTHGGRQLRLRSVFDQVLCCQEQLPLNRPRL